MLDFDHQDPGIIPWENHENDEKNPNNISQC